MFVHVCVDLGIFNLSFPNLFRNQGQTLLYTLSQPSTKLMLTHNLYHMNVYIGTDTNLQGHC